MRYAILIAIFGLLGCRDFIEDGRQGTSVGNPGKGTARIAAGKDVTITSAVANSATMTLDGCDESGVRENLYDDATLDLINPEEFDVPPGEWCAIYVEIRGLEIDGGGDDGGTFLIDLGLVPFTLFLPELEVDAESTLIVELGSPGWLDGRELGMPEDVVINDDSELHDALVERVAGESALYVGEDEEPIGFSDEDKTKDWDWDDKDKHKVDKEEPDPEATPGCNSSGPAPGTWLMWLPLVLILASRRESAR